MKMNKLLSLFAVVAFFGISGCDDSGGDKPADTTKLPTDADIALAQLCDAAPEVEITTPSLTCRAPNCEYAAIGAKGGKDGAGPYLIAVEGLPPSLSANYGVIHGQPGQVAEGTYPLNVTVTDANCIDKQATGTVTLTVAAAPRPDPVVPEQPEETTTTDGLSIPTKIINFFTCSQAELRYTSSFTPSARQNCAYDTTSCVHSFQITSGEGPFEFEEEDIQPSLPQWMKVVLGGRKNKIGAIWIQPPHFQPGDATSYDGSIQITDSACPQRTITIPLKIALTGTPPAAPAPPAPTTCTVSDVRMTFATAGFDYSGTTARARVKFCNNNNHCHDYTIREYSNQFDRGKKNTYTLKENIVESFASLDCSYLNNIYVEVFGGTQADIAEDYNGWILRGFRVDAKITGTLTRGEDVTTSDGNNWTPVYNNPSVYVSLRRGDNPNRNQALFTPDDIAVGIKIKTSDAAGSGTDASIRLFLNLDSGISANLRNFISNHGSEMPYWYTDPDDHFNEIIRVLDWSTDDQDDFATGAEKNYGGYFPDVDPVYHKYRIGMSNIGRGECAVGSCNDAEAGKWKPENFTVAFISPGKKEYLRDGHCDGDSETINQWFTATKNNWPSDFKSGHPTYQETQSGPCPFLRVQPCPSDGACE